MENLSPRFVDTAIAICGEAGRAWLARLPAKLRTNHRRCLRRLDEIDARFCEWSPGEPMAPYLDALVAQKRAWSRATGVATILDQTAGAAFVRAVLAFGAATFAPDRFRLTVASFNERAIRVYERAGFRAVAAFPFAHAVTGRAFLIMERDVEGAGSPG